MFINKIQLNSFRNFKFASLEASRGVNVLHGINGSGKTSIIEAIYYLSLARSFRTQKNNAIINSDDNQLTLFAELINESNDIGKIGIMRNISGDILVKYNGTIVNKVSFLANNLCVQLISPDSFSMLEGGPNLRREFLDWGCFYHYPQFSEVYLKFKKVLKQRNALLQSKSTNEQLQPWNELFLNSSLDVNKYRTDYLELFNREATKIINELLPSFTVSIELSSGFKIDKASFEDQLFKSKEREFAFGYSLFGPHKADLKIKIGGKNAVDVLSRGQQKLLMIALRLVQGELYQTKLSSNCVFLIDDVTSELDMQNQLRLLNYIGKLAQRTQFFITVLSSGDMLNDIIAVCPNAKVFHVEQNDIKLYSN